MKNELMKSNIVYFDITSLDNTIFSNFYKFLEKRNEKFTICFISEDDPFKNENFFGICEKVISLGHKISLHFDFCSEKENIERFYNIVKENFSGFEIIIKFPLNLKLYENLKYFKEKINLNPNICKIFCPMEEDKFEEIKILDNNIQNLNLNIKFLREIKNGAYVEYSPEIEDYLKSWHWVKSEIKIDIPISMVKNQTNFTPKNRICSCGNKFFYIEKTGLVKRCLTCQTNGWDMLGNFAESDDVRILPDFSPCFSKSVLCNNLISFKEKNIIFDKEDIPYDDRDKKYDVAVVGYGWAYNYGALLTNYGMMKQLQNMGYNPLMIEKPRDFTNENYHDEVYAQTFARKFNEKYFKNNLSRIYNDKNDMRELNSVCNTYILGSDQTLRHKLHQNGHYYMGMDFLNPDKKKIAYSAGLGHFEYLGEEPDWINMRYYLQKYDYIAVREPNTKYVLKEQFNIDSVNVVDPMYFIKKEDYEYLASESDEKLYKDCIVAFILTPDRAYKKELDKLAEKYSSEVVVMCEYWNKEVLKSFGFKNVISPSVESWVNYIKNSKLFITDSFHAVYTALILEKQFLLVINNNVYFKRGMARFPIFSRIPEMRKRMTYGIESIGDLENLFEKISFSSIHEVFDKEMEFSISWLKNAIEAPKSTTNLSLEESVNLLHDRLNLLENTCEKLLAFVKDDKNNFDTSNKLNSLEETVKQLIQLVNSNENHQTKDNYDNSNKIGNIKNNLRKLFRKKQR